MTPDNFNTVVGAIVLGAFGFTGFMVLFAYFASRAISKHFQKIKNEKE